MKRQTTLRPQRVVRGFCVESQFRRQDRCQYEPTSGPGSTRREQIVAPGAYDPISARLVQSLGFNAVYCGGYISGAHLAVTEPLMTMTEQLSVAERVVRAVPLPVICDADAGYGEPVHAMHTVRSFEQGGLAGIHIEDQFFPKRASYHAGLEHVIPMDEFLQKIGYALRARTDRTF